MPLIYSGKKKMFPYQSMGKEKKLPRGASLAEKEAKEEEIQVRAHFPSL